MVVVVSSCCTSLTTHLSVLFSNLTTFPNTIPSALELICTDTKSPGVKIVEFVICVLLVLLVLLVLVELLLLVLLVLVELELLEDELVELVELEGRLGHLPS